MKYLRLIFEMARQTPRLCSFRLLPLNFPLSPDGCLSEVNST